MRCELVGLFANKRIKAILFIKYSYIRDEEFLKLKTNLNEYFR